MSSDESKTVVRRWFDAINRHDLGGVGEVVAEDATWEVPVAAEPLRVRAAVQELVGGFFTAFSDLKLEITEQIAEGDRVVTYVTASGTNDGELLGMPATGNHVSWKVIHTHTVRDGELKDDFVLFDRLALMERLQATPALPGRLATSVRRDVVLLRDAALSSTSPRSLSGSALRFCSLCSSSARR